MKWLTEAKREETRQQRLAKSLELLAEGKTRMWKQERKAGAARPPVPSS